ncbi:MAG: UDP-N-acetylmuramoyl-L-alanyl-D-glutamate--2,6-diaminopimelate ligase [Planctomycetes bacterium]|nr:UDP-N-acetylmuramoyl-L-alanyl-D-glutamate--2,6-diaminopimelate ligase [Planctomycetota bacterium]
MTFDELLTLAALPDKPTLCLDSRDVKQGGIFVAVKGTVLDGHDFIEQAINNGAKFIVTQKPCDCKTAEIITTDDTAKAAAILAQTLKDNPASKLTNLAVTGTNGKTTVAFLVRAVIQSAGQKCGLITTITYDTAKETLPATLTTPDSLTIADIQKQMVAADAKFMVTEASSHALSQNRLAAIDFKAAAFTNLTQDHLDYHKTKEDYFDAKLKLFENLSPDATAVLNKQDYMSNQIAEKTNAKIIFYAVDQDADLTAHIESMDLNGTIFTLRYAGQTQKVKTPLFGKHNISNHLAAAGICLAAGFDLKTIAAGLSSLKAIPGRLEPVKHDRNFSVLIDYAHTDDALKNVLTALRPLCKGKLTIVFGCGGDRDKTKRPKMAAVAEKFADNLMLTSDNPRSEDPCAIIGEMYMGLQNPTADSIIAESDRKKAIESAIRDAKENDIILIAGKGHETYQIIDGKKNQFSDKQVAANYLKNLK